MEEQAVQYAERYGIIEYSIKGGYMVYYASYPQSGHDKRTTYKVSVNLTTGKEETREQLKRYYKKGEINWGL